MANINDFKIINKKSKKYFDLLAKVQPPNIKIKKERDQERIGFYFFILEQITGIKDFSDLIYMMTDQNFNTQFFNENFDDFGIDAVNIDKEKHLIQLFNFKFSEKFSGKKSKINEAINSTKFINFIKTQKVNGVNGKIKYFLEEIIKKINTNDEWNIELYVVSNENFNFKKDQNINNLENLYGLKVINIGLDEISDFITTRPKPIDSVLVLNKDAVMSFSESNLSSEKSYMIRLPLFEIVRITSNNETLRLAHNLEDFSKLSEIEIDFSVLFDNVRGFVNKSKYNKNIFDTLEKDPSKFFMYNNGLTFIVKDIKSKDINGGLKIKLSLHDIQIVNGGQTLRTIHQFNKKDKKNINNNLSNAEILVRIFNISDNYSLANKIAEYTNSQNSISVIDLKSLREEQLQIEQYLADQGILYVRKSGDTGNDIKKYDKRISMEKFGQILFALDGKPEKTSNQKKIIFDKKYEHLFIENFKLENSVSIINKYFEIRNEYLKVDQKASDQKIFYILYLNKKLQKQKLNKLILNFEKYIKKFPTEKDLSDARKLIRNDFKEFIDKKFNLIYDKN